MSFVPSSRVPLLPEDRAESWRTSGARGDGFSGGCLSLIAVLVEIPVAFLLALSVAMRGLSRSRDYEAVRGQVETPPMDWVPVFWLGGFTLAVLVTAGLFLCSAHPFAGTFQLLIGAVALMATIASGMGEYERAHPAPAPACPTSAGVPCAPQDPASSPPHDRGSTGHQCRSGGDSDECADSGR